MRTPEQDRLFEEWAERAKQVDVLEAAQRFGASLKRAGKEYVGPCPHCGGKDRFSVNPVKQVFNCRGAVGGGVVAMAMHVHGCDFIKACEILTGDPPPRGKAREISPEERRKWEEQREAAQRKAQQQKEEQERRDAERAHTAVEVWASCVPIEGTLAEKYLMSRGIPKPPQGWPDCLGFHPALDYELEPWRARMPALVGRVQDVSHETIAVWQIYLTKDGRKADVPNVKVGRGPAAGGAIRIGGDAPHIGVGEGIETALGVWTLIKYRYPVWSCMDTGKMVRFEPPLFVKKVTTYPDGDLPKRSDSGEILPPAGMRAADALHNRLVEVEIPNPIVRPPNNADWLNVMESVLAFEGGDEHKGADD